MNKNEEENQRDESTSASEASLDERLTAEATEKLDDTETTADGALEETKYGSDEPEGVLVERVDNATHGSAESGKDWLVDTGLAAAINPENDVPQELSEDIDSEGAVQEIAEPDLYDDDDTDGDDEGNEYEDVGWEDEGEGEDDDYEDDLTESDDEDDFEEDEQASVAHSASGDPAPQPRAVWPMVVGCIALVLIGVGGWDLFHERTILQARITELEENQARTRESEALDARTVSELEVENAALKLQLNTLYQDYNAAMAELSNGPITGDASEDSTDAAETVTKSSPITALEALDEESESGKGSQLTSSDTEGWFINIGAYASSQSANTWLLRLQNSGYDVSVTKIQTAEGITLNRVRLAGFESKAAAKNVALELETDYGTGPLWVGALRRGN